MNKYLITIIVPLAELEFDLYVPNNKKVGTIKNLILIALAELSNNSFVKTAKEVKMIDRPSGTEFNNDVYVKDSGIKNGSKVIII